MNKKNKGFSLMMAIVASLILMGVSVGIISSINRSLDQSTNIARSNQAFFAVESGKEAAFFHHNVRGAGLKLNNNPYLNFAGIGNGATVNWEIDGREEEVSSGKVILEGVIHENEKITIPLYWDKTKKVVETVEMIDLVYDPRMSLRLSFPSNPVFENSGTNQVAIVWSVSRKNNGKYETWIPTSPDAADPCVTDSSFFCKQDMPSYSGVPSVKHFDNANGNRIKFNDISLNGKILPTGTSTDLQAFMNTGSDFEISFQPVVPFVNDSSEKFVTLNFKLEGDSNVKIPRNNYTITSTVDFGDFDKTTISTHKENPSIGAFDYLIFQ